MKRALLVLLLALSACGGTRREAAAVVGAVDRFRAGENANKPELADVLASTPCSDAEVCAAKEACVAAAEPTARGLRLQREVEQGLADVAAGKSPKDGPAAQALPGKLEESNRLRDAGDRALEGCNEKVTGLRLKYSL